MGSGAEKVQKLKEYKNTVFESYFAQIYSVRVSNLVSLITLTQTGRRYYKNQISLKETEEESPRIPQGTDDWESQKKQILENMNRDSITIEAALKPKCLQDQTIQMQKCESFSRDVFTRVLKTFLSEKLLPKIRYHVQKHMNNLKLKQDVQRPQLEILLQYINKQILNDVFKRDMDRVRLYQQEMDNLSNDSLDPDNGD